MTDKIVQIMPVPETLYWTYELDGKEIKQKPLCIALTVQGDIQVIDISDDGVSIDVTEISNFKRIIWNNLQGTLE